MNPCQIIARKRDGESLAADDLASFIRGYVSGEVADYQMAALAMAIYLRGMSDDETSVLTSEMLRSGNVLEAKDRSRRVDKHSTGGIGDKTSLIVAPLLACCGLQAPMISGRGLGPTGGTLDKLESIPGFRTDLSTNEIAAIVDRVGCVITGATADLVPADRKLYALRDVTATVGSIPLITASIMSKKLAENIGALVLDVKFGSGAFMKSHADAEDLARSMVGVGAKMGVNTAALVTDMNQPLGRLAGNAVEVDETVDVLAGGGPADLRKLSLALAAEVLLMSGVAANPERADAILAGHLANGAAMSKFREMIAAQGGNLDAPRRRAESHTVVARQSGFVSAMNGEQLGMAIIDMGGGRKRAHESIDHSVGLEMLVRLGDRVERSQPLVRIFSPAEKRAAGARLVEQAIEIGPKPAPHSPLIVKRISSTTLGP